MKKHSSMLKKATSLALALTFAITAMNLSVFAQSVDSSPNAVGTTQSGTLNSSANVPADVKPVKTYTVALGKTYKLPADAKQTGDSYSASNSSILKVDGKTGSFTTLANGTAYIVVANNGTTRYIKVNVGTGTANTTTAANTTSALTGYSVTVKDKTTLATSSGSKDYPVTTYYFYSANGTVLGSISGATFNKVISTANRTGSTSEWLTADFNLYRGLSGSSIGTSTGGNTADNAGTSKTSLGTLINNQRTTDGIHELNYDSSMQDLANTRAKELSQKYSHERPDGTYPQYAEIMLGGGGGNTQTASKAYQSFYDSTAHRNIMLDEKYNSYTVGYYQSANGNHYWVVLFN